MKHVLRLGVLLSLGASVAWAENAGGLKWTTPAGWTAEGPRSMRAATYKIAPAKGDSEAGECAVFYFGPDQGGSVDANIKRWISQFELPDGKPAESAAQIKKRTQNGMNVTTIDLAGTYMASMGPMSPTKTSKPGFRLLGGIVEGPQGAVFFKFTGPAKTVGAARADFDKLLASVSKG